MTSDLSATALQDTVAEMAKQATLGLKMFCVGVHESGEAEWISWPEAFARLLAALADARKDAVRLDWLEQQGAAFIAKHPEFGWKARESRTERGFRLSTTSETPNYPTPRAALDAARASQPTGEGTTE